MGRLGSGSIGQQNGVMAGNFCLRRRNGIIINVAVGAISQILFQQRLHIRERHIGPNWSLSGRQSLSGGDAHYSNHRIIKSVPGQQERVF